jgi:hypothetical protein
MAGMKLWGLEYSEISRQKSRPAVSGETAFQLWNRHLLKSVEELPRQRAFVLPQFDAV